MMRYNLLLLVGFICFSRALSENLELHHGHQHHLHKHHGHGYRGPPYKLPGVFQYSNQDMVTEITLGHPRRTFKAIVDTGSTLLWIKSSLFNSTSFQPVSYSECKRNSYFEPTQTLHSDDSLRQCVYALEYMQGPVSGYLGNDTIVLTTLENKGVSFPAVFGRTISYGQGWDNIDAVLGLGPASISLVSQLGDAIDHKFSYCFVGSKYLNSSIVTPLIFGEVEGLRVGSEGVQSIAILPYTPELPAEYDDLYKVNLSRILIGDQVFNTSYPVAVVDSGSSISQLSADLHDQVKAYYDQHVKVPSYVSYYFILFLQLDMCYNMTGHEDYKFPSMSLQFEGGSTIEVEGDNLLVKYEIGGKPVTCIGLQSRGGEVSLLGNNVQRNHHLMFDTNSSIITYKPTECHKLAI